MQSEEEVNFPALLEQGIDKLLCIDQSYENGDIETQREDHWFDVPGKTHF
jgi:hypothetical protein